MGVVGGVAGAVDDDDPAVRQALVEGDRSRRGRPAGSSAEDLEDRLADAPRAGRARRPGRPPPPARAGSCRPRPRGPARRVGPVGGEVRGGHPDDLGQERRERAVAVAGVEPLAQACLDARAGDSSPRAGSARPRSRRPAGSHRSGARPRARTARRTNARRHRPAARARGERVGHGGDVLELALDRVRRRVARGTAAAAVDRRGRSGRAARHRADDAERRVVGGRAVDEDERRPAHRSLNSGDRRAVARRDDEVAARAWPGGHRRSARRATTAAASSRIQVAPGAPGELGRPAPRVALGAEDPARGPAALSAP